MLGFIKYGEKEESIVNLNCKVSVKPYIIPKNFYPVYTISLYFFKQIYHLLNYIRKKCEYKEDLELDLCDLNGEVKHLNENLDTYANTILKDREELILIKLESNSKFNVAKQHT